MRRPIAAISVLLLAAFASIGSGAIISISEGTAETDPITVTTNLVLTSPTVATAESAVVVGFIHPGISPSPISAGSRSAGLFEPGSTTLLSDYVLLTVGAVRGDPQFGAAQDVTIEFHSTDTLVANLPSGFPFGGGVVEDGTLQDISGFLATMPEGLIVKVSSLPSDDPAVPEPTSLALWTLGGLALAGYRWRRRQAACH